jgi:FAD/FMN-containing dehydrogenase
VARSTIESLRQQVRAPLITADDPGYDEARAVHNGMFDRMPSVIVRAEQVADVIAAVNFARDSGLDLSIRGGGHSAPGFGTNNGGLVIDLSLMRHVQVDPKARIARAAGGATWGDFNHATHAFGLATTGGIVSTTGIAGLTLGGGIGYLARKYGLTCDNLISADVVLADGSFARASAEDNADLFWALRGGGGNFGVVTSFEYRLHPVSDVYVGIFFYEIDQTRNLLRFFREFIKDAPREYGGFPAFQAAPPVPFIPEERHGDAFCAAVVHWAGGLDQGETAMKPFRDLAQPVGQMVAPMAYPWLNSAFDEIFPKGMRMYWKGNFVTELSDAAIEAHAEHGPKVPEVSATMHLYPINGACHDVGPEDTAFAYRNATFAPVYVVGWTDPAKDAERIQWVRDYYEATAPHSEPGGYVNFMDDDDQDRVRDNYRGNFDRLARIKAKYDPDNLFHLNQNIAPAR